MLIVLTGNNGNQIVRYCLQWGRGAPQRRGSPSTFKDLGPDLSEPGLVQNLDRVLLGFDGDLDFD